MSFLHKFLLLFNIFSILNFLKINDENKQYHKINSNSFKKIISFTIKNNPNDIKNFLPELPKVFTNVGLQCDFPFIYEEREYKSGCATRKKDNKQICKVSINFGKKEKFSEEENNKRKYFSSLLDDNKKLIKINEDYFAECLGIDETEKILTEFLETGQIFDVNKKLLTDLFSEIKQEILKSKETPGLSELFKLAENYCKSANFDFDCLYKNLILPVSQTNSLNSLSKNIFKIIEKYKEKLKKFVKKSEIVKLRFRQYDFIKEDNLNFGAVGNIGNINITNFNQLDLMKEEKEIDLEDVFGINNSDISGEAERLINKDVLSDSQSRKFSKIFFKKFIKILITVYQTCTEECKSALEFLFIDNFGDKAENIKKEIIGFLFKKKDLDFNVEKDIYSPVDKNYFIYNNKQFPTNNNIKTFLNYKAWSTRYLISILYRYILIEKNFFTEIVKGELSEEELHQMLFINNFSTYQDEKSLYKIMKQIPIITPYYNFTHKLSSKLEMLFGEWTQATNLIFNEYNKTKNVLNDLDKRLTIYDSELEEKINYFKDEALMKLKELTKVKQDLETKSKILEDSKKRNSTLNNLKINSRFTDIEYVTDIIYQSDYFSNECHKFLHYHTYLDNSKFGLPFVEYVSLSSTATNFFIEFDEDIRLFEIFALLSFNENTRHNHDLAIKVFTNSEMELNIDSLFINCEKGTNGTFSFTRTDKYNYEYVINVFKLKETKDKRTKFQIVFKGKFEEKMTKEKYFKFLMNEIILEENMLQFSKDESINDEINSKCTEKFSNFDVCFNSIVYKTECELSCKILSRKHLKGIKERSYLKESEEKYNGDKRTLYKMKFFKFNIKFNKKKLIDDQIDAIRNKKLEGEFIQTCINYCKAFKWNIPVYKCMYRNIEYNTFSSLLHKCQAMGEWKIVSRNTNQNSWFNFTNTFSRDDILFGKKNYTEFVVKDEFMPYFKLSAYNPLSDHSFNLPFDASQLSTEYMFASGDMRYFAVLDQTQLLVKGAPYKALSALNNRMLYKRNKNSKEINSISVFNLLYNTDFMSNEGIVIYDSLYNRNSSVLFSNNKSFRDDAMSILKNNKGANIFIRNRIGEACKFSEVLNKFILLSDLASKEFYTENVVATNGIFGFTESSQDIIYKLPNLLKDNSLLIRTKPYQNKYSLFVNMPVRVYLALELTRNIEKNAENILKDRWQSLNGTDNMIEMINTDLEEDIISILAKSEDNVFLKDKIYQYVSINKMTIFYKDFNTTKIDLAFSFFDYDDLYSCRHLLLIQPHICSIAENNNSNGNMTVIIDKKTFIKFLLKIEDIGLQHSYNISSTMTNITNNICQREVIPKENKIINEYLKYSEKMSPLCDESMNKLNENEENKNKTNFVAFYTKPLIRVNNNGCIVALTKNGDLFYKNSRDLNSSDWSLNKNNVKNFEMTENTIIILDAYDNLVIQTNFFQNNNCILEKDKWVYIDVSPPMKLVKFSISIYNCIWLIDEKNDIFYGNVQGINKKFELLKSDIKPPLENEDKVKIIYQDKNRLYILTNKNQLYLKENVYDIINDKCLEGNVI